MAAVTTQKINMNTTAYYEMLIDPVGGLVSINVGAHLLDQSDVRIYVRHLTNAINKCRRLNYGVRVLVDMTRGPVQKPEVASEFRAVNELITPTDSLALVVASSLAKMQTGRVTENANIKAFLTTDEAREWLEAR